MDLTATATSELLITRKTISNYFMEFRELILEESIRKQQKELGFFEPGKSYFGVKRVRRKRERGAAGKKPVLGILKRKEKFL